MELRLATERSHGLTLYFKHTSIALKCVGPNADSKTVNGWYTAYDIRILTNSDGVYRSYMIFCKLRQNICAISGMSWMLLTLYTVTTLCHFDTETVNILIFILNTWYLSYRLRDLAVKQLKKYILWNVHLLWLWKAKDLNSVKKRITGIDLTLGWYEWRLRNSALIERISVKK
jgi:hypothetical protein